MPLPYSDVPAFRRDPLRLLLERARRAPPGFVPLHLGLRPIWLATDPEIARQVLIWSPQEIDKGRLVQTLLPLLDRSLLTNVGAAHRRTKTAIHRHVRRNAIVQNLGRLTSIINTFCARLAVDGEIHTGPDLAELALQLACVAVFGDDVLAPGDRTALVGAVKIVEAEIADDMFRLPIVPRLPWNARQRSRRLSNAHRIVSFVTARVRQKENRSEIIKGLEEAGLNDEELSAEILGLLIAGHHTTGASFGWVLYHLATEPEMAEMIALEADTVLAAIERNDRRALDNAALSRAYLNELLRLYPAGWWTSREVAMPLTVAGHRFKAGDTIMVSPWQLHRDPRFWSEPDTLRLDRCFTETAYMPFGIGPRACIGMAIALVELQLLALQLASAFTFEIASEAAQSVRPHPSVTLLFPNTAIKATPRTETEFRRQVA